MRGVDRRWTAGVMGTRLIGWINQMLPQLPDPRRETRNKLHKLHDILMIVLCAVLSGVEDWVGMEAFAEEKEAWLRGFLELPPSMTR